MRQYMQSFIFLSMSALAFSCSDQSTPISSPEQTLSEPSTLAKSGHSANGQALYTFLGAKQTFSFHARQFPDGSVRGSFQSKIHADGTMFHGIIDCLTISGNVATMSGTITKSNYEDFDFTGWDVWFKVIDNGEGQNGPDEWTDFWFFFELADCTSPNPDPFVAELFPIEAGNVQVKQ